MSLSDPSHCPSSSSAAASAGSPRRWRLPRKGIRTQVIEQAPEFKEIGAGIQLGPNVFRMFEVLGLTEAISKLAVFPESLIMLDAITGEEVTRIPLDDGVSREVQTSLCADLSPRPA